MTLRCFPAFTLRRVDSAHQLADVLDRFDELAERNDHFELFTFPYSDRALVLERNRTDEAPKPKSRAVAFLNDVLLENWALEAMAATGKAMPRTIPALARFAGLVATGSEQPGPQPPDLRQPAQRPLHRDGVRGAARATARPRCGG